MISRMSGLRAQHSVCTKEGAVGKSAEKARLAEPPVREDPARGVAIPELPEEEVRAQIQQEVQELMSPSGSFDADVLVIGSGPGGYIAAIRAAQLGGRVICVERDAKEWGGTCLNWGCIPTKAMIASVERLIACREAAKMGVIVGDVSFDFGKIMERKDKIVSTQRGGVQTLLKSNHVRMVEGFARLTGPHSRSEE